MRDADVELTRFETVASSPTDLDEISVVVRLSSDRKFEAVTVSFRVDGASAQTRDVESQHGWSVAGTLAAVAEAEAAVLEHPQVQAVETLRDQLAAAERPRVESEEPQILTDGGHDVRTGPEPRPGDDAAGWDAVGFVSASSYRLSVLAVLVEGPETPSQIADAVGIDITKVSRALSDLREHDLAELLVPEERRKGRYYGITSKGETVAAKLDDMAAIDIEEVA